MLLRKIAKQLSVSQSFLSQIRTGKRPLSESLRTKLVALDAYRLLITNKHSTTVIMEREMGLEPTTTCLEGRSSTTELLPLALSF